MKRTDDIRKRTVEVTNLLPGQVAADALILPWRRGKLDPPEGSVLASAGPAVMEEVADYRDEREVMLTSGGALPARFLFLLSLPVKGEASLPILEERLRDCLFQAGILGLGELAIPILEFTPYTENFADLVASIWSACREFIARERGPQRVLFIVDERDLRGQYLRHFLGRKEAEERGWELEKELAKPPLDIPRTAASSPIRFRGEKVLTLDLVETELLDLALGRLIDDYQEGKVLEPSLARLRPQMREAFEESIGDDASQAPLPARLRILGSRLALQLPWELLPRGDGFLGEEHLLTRGTNFLHFRKDRRPNRGEEFSVSFRVVGEPAGARELVSEIMNLDLGVDPGFVWTMEEPADVHLIHCLDADAAARLLESERPTSELVVLDLPLPASGGAEASHELAELARGFVAHGARRVLAPLACFRDERERKGFIAAFYERLLSGESAGEALRCAQQSTRDRFGAESGWWLYRIFGQTDEVVIPTSVRKQRGEEVLGRF